jgi:peptidoglycan/xylan/chitin deacetylase (PgdA/CDA1 family)
VRAPIRYYHGPWPENRKGVVCLTFDVDVGYAYTKGTQAWGALPRWLGLTTLVAGGLSVESRGYYGLYTGLPRILDLLKRKNIEATFFVPARNMEKYPEQLRTIHEAGHEIGNHGYAHEAPVQLVRTPRREAALLEKAQSVFRSALGFRPVGYRSPAWDLNRRTPRLLEQAGFLYDSSLFAGDAPYWLSVYDPAVELLEIPIDWSKDDAAYFLFFKPPVTFAQFHDPESVFRLWRTELDGVVDAGGVFTLTCHPSIIGRFHRLEILEKLIDHATARGDVWFPTLEQVARHVQDRL